MVASVSDEPLNPRELLLGRAIRVTARPIPGEESPRPFKGHHLERVVVVDSPPRTGFRVIAVECYEDGVIVRCQLVPPAPLPSTLELRDDRGTEYALAHPSPWHGTPTRFGDAPFVPAVPGNARELELRAAYADETRRWPGRFVIPLLPSETGPA
jgi:hypothetical protein